MKTFLTAVLAALSLLLAGCTDTSQFRVNGTIAGKPTLNLRVGYYADGAYRTTVTAAREGEFEFYGTSRTPALVTVMDYDYRPLGALYAVNGETYEMTLDRDKPFSADVRGNDVNEEWSRFLRDKADSLSAGPRQANAAVEAYIRANPDKVSSTILLLTLFDASREPGKAADLIELISPQAQPSSLTEGFMASLQRVASIADSTTVLDIPYYERRGRYPRLKPSESAFTLIAFTTRTSRPQALPDALRRLSGKIKKDRLGIADISLDPDTADWRKSVQPDSASWRQGWAAGTVSAIGVDRLAIPSLPFYVVCDSTGRQIYRGSDMNRACALADSLSSI